MPKVICTLPNASSLINGVVFSPHKLGVISDDIDQDTADDFLEIDGYMDGSATAKAKAPAATPAPAEG